MQTAHRDIVSRMQENFDQEMEGLRNNVDSAHGEQVQELQSLLEERHKRVSRAAKTTATRASQNNWLKGDSEVLH